MHSAPSVSYPVGRSHFSGALLLGAWLSGAAACGAWWVASPLSAWRLGVALLAVLLTGGVAAWQWQHMPRGSLSWDQERWTWSGEQGRAGNPEVGLDLQHWLLLGWRTGGHSNWLWLERASHPEKWVDLRRAVYSRARAPSPDAPTRPHDEA